MSDYRRNSKNKPAYYVLWIEVNNELTPVVGSTEKAAKARAQLLYGDHTVQSMQTQSEWLEEMMN